MKAYRRVYSFAVSMFGDFREVANPGENFPIYGTQLDG